MTGSSSLRPLAAGLRWGTAGICLAAFVAVLLSGARITGRSGPAVANVVSAGAALLVFLLMVCPGQRAHRMRERLCVLSIGSLIAVAVVEVFVRVVQPFPVMLRGGQIDLPFNTQRVITDVGIDGLDETITVSFNSLGFRGPELPKDPDDHLTILCVGGSTTQCIYLSEGSTWPDRLADKLSRRFRRVWINNAGLDGHSTYGHLHLIEQYVSVLRPRVVLFYVGVNDVGRDDLNPFDQGLRLTNATTSQPALIPRLHRTLLRSSELFALLDSLRRHQMARSRGLVHQTGVQHQGIDGEGTLLLSDDQRQQILQSHSRQNIEAYRHRLTRLITMCRDAGIRPVLVTQPALYGDGVDDIRGTSLETIDCGGGIDGWTRWRILQMYNEVTIQVGSEMDVPVIRVADRMPRSSRCYYDLIHYTNEGAEQVAALIAEGLSPILETWYPEFVLPPSP